MTKAAQLAKMGEVLTNSQIGGRRNIVINGAMQVAQRGTTTGQGNASAYSAVDRMNIHGGSTAGRLTSSQDSDSPVFFGNSLKLDCTTADTSIAAGEFLLLEQKLEGQDLQQLEFNQSSAKATTISFYVKGNAAAQYTFALQYHLASGTARWFTKGFAVTTDWARITITIPGDTQASDGSNYGIADNTATGANLMIWLHGGTNFSSGTHQDTAWADRDYTTLFQDNQTSFYDSTDRTFFFTGFQFELGSQATPFEHRSFGEELALCQRYFRKIIGECTVGAGVWYLANQPLASFSFAPTRANPTMAVSSADALKCYGNNYARNGNDTSCFDLANAQGFARLNFTPGSNGTAGDGATFQISGDAEFITIDAEL